MGPLFISTQEQQRRQLLLQQNDTGMQQTGQEDSPSTGNIPKASASISTSVRADTESPDSSQTEDPPPLTHPQRRSSSQGGDSPGDQAENSQQKRFTKYQQHHHHYYNHYRSYLTTTSNPGGLSNSFARPEMKLKEGHQARYPKTTTCTTTTQALGVNTKNKICSSSTSNLRRYIVLLQDCVAIKFVPVNGTNDHRCFQQEQHQLPFDFAGHRGGGGGGAPSSITSLPNQASYSHNNASTSSAAGTTQSNNVASGIGSLPGVNNGAPAEVDEQHSVQHGFYLYKAFREANLKCYWNTSMCEAMRRLEYKGYLVPSTILVYSTCPRYLNVLRTAWSRRILRHPPGYRVDMLGDIEEVVAQPVQQGQFAPLSDSLCWVILELTSTGQEAFVDSIMQYLVTAFPTMSPPSKELVFQTLEKLIREQKIYQTSHGYYIVTPDVSTFMTSRSATPAPVGPQTCFLHNGTYSSMRPRSLAVADGVFNELDKISWGSAASILDSDELLRRSNYFYCNGGGEEQKPVLKRHNSMRIIRNNRETDYIPRPHMGARSLSFRLSKGNSLFDSDKEDYFDPELDGNAKGVSLDRRQKLVLANESSSAQLSKPVCSDGSSQTNETQKKRACFLRRWFSFRRLKTKTPNTMPRQQLPQKSITSSNLKSMKSTTSSSTQTIRSLSSRSIDNVRVEPLTTEQQNSTLIKSKWNSLPNTRQHVRKSILQEDSPFYDELVRHSGRHSSGRLSSLGYCTNAGERITLTDRGGNGDVIIGDGRNYYRSSSRRSRHLSGTTNRTISPCPSSVVSAIYASIANNKCGARVRDYSPGVADKCRNTMGRNSALGHHHNIHPCPQIGPQSQSGNPSLTRQLPQRKSKQSTRPRSAYEILYSPAQLQPQQQHEMEIGHRSSTLSKSENINTSTINPVPQTVMIASSLERNDQKIPGDINAEFNKHVVVRIGSSGSEQDDETAGNGGVGNLLMNNSCSDDADSNRESSDVSH